MVLYFNVQEKDRASFLDICSEFSDLTEGIFMSGIWKIDTTETTKEYLSEREISKIPKGYLLVWNPITSPDLVFNRTIARFNEEKLQWCLMDFNSMEPMIEVLAFGAKKYDKNNWKRSIPTKESLLNSLERHFIELKESDEQGIVHDKDSKLRSIGHLMCNAMFYSYWEEKTNGLFENYKENPKQ